MENTIEEMERLGANRANITAVLGPTISQQNYEVGPEFPSAFLDQDKQNARYFVPSQNADHHMFDLTGYIVDRLKRANVNANAVNRCTYAEEENFYSYRRTTHRGENDYGRQLSALTISS